VIKDRESILRNVHQILGINIACQPMAENRSPFDIAQDALRYAKPALPQAGIYNDKIGDTESE
jgi:hypothetical protein